MQFWSRPAEEAAPWMAWPGSLPTHTWARSLRVWCSPSPSSVSRAGCSWSCRDSWRGGEETQRGWSGSVPESETHSFPALGPHPAGSLGSHDPGPAARSPGPAALSALNRLGPEKCSVPPQVTQPTGGELDLDPGLAPPGRATNPGSTLEGCPSGGEAAGFQEKEPWTGRLQA